MSEEIRKRSVSRRRSVSAASSSSSEGGAPPVEPMYSSACGHSSCERTCNVRYVGPVSHIRDHHAMHAAQGIGHIWSASIITGFAIVLTGAVAFQTAQARTMRETAASSKKVRTENAQIMERLNRLEAIMLDTRRICRGELDEIPEEDVDPEILNQKQLKKEGTQPPVTENAAKEVKKTP